MRRLKRALVPISTTELQEIRARFIYRFSKTTTASPAKLSELKLLRYYYILAVSEGDSKR